MLQIWHCFRDENQKSQVLLETGVNPHRRFCLTAQVRAGGWGAAGVPAGMAER